MTLQLMGLSLGALGTILLRLVHVLAAAAMFGAMFYSFTVLQPRARRYFQNPKDFEEFITFISNGARWKVLSGFGLIAVSGFALILLRQSDMNRAWTIIIAAKVVVLFLAVAFFCFVSWRLWPARVFATPDEIPRLQRAFRLVGFTMLTLMAVEFVLSIIAHAL
jgi:uncharacterized membrane protein